MNLTRIIVSAARTADGWSVTVELPDGQRRPTRAIARAGGFPVPRPAGPLASEFGDTTLVRETFERFVLRDPSGEDLAQLGTYLFDALLAGDWPDMEMAAGADGIELALRSSAADHEFNRLPWELMHGPRDFLVGDDKRAIGITRLVEGSSAELNDLPAALRVLFVMGTGRQVETIRPGREYMMLLQRLEAHGISFSSRVLVQATRQGLEDEIVQWHPEVVHFICHGQFDHERGEAKLELTSMDDPAKIDPVDSHELLSIMREPGHTPPQVIVLNACHSGETRGLARQQAAPMAARLVAGGIPMVVGMSGQVADRACRLFTRRFYEALLQGESVVAATAEGRRAGFKGADARRTVDWAFPTLFLSERASPDLRIDESERELVARTHRLADSFRTVRNPKVFCGRFELVEDAYRRLLRVDVPTGTRVLAVRVSHAAAAGQAAKFGKTRLLEEIAARAASERFLPCLLTPATGFDPPDNLPRLALALLDAMVETRSRLLAEGFEVSTGPPSRILDVIEGYTGGIPAEPADGTDQDRFERRLSTARQVLRDDPAKTASLNHRYIGDAIRDDLAALSDEVRVMNPIAGMLVLVDEVHLFDAGARDLTKLLDQNGLGRAGRPVPVVFAFSMPQDSGYSTGVGALHEFLESRRPFVETVDLEPFADPLVDPLPYQQFLYFGMDIPLMVNHRARAEDVRTFYALLGQQVRGVPSALKSPNIGIDAVIACASQFGDNPPIQTANDNDVLDLLRNGA